MKVIFAVILAAGVCFMALLGSFIWYEHRLYYDLCVAPTLPEARRGQQNLEREESSEFRQSVVKEWGYLDPQAVPALVKGARIAGNSATLVVLPDEWDRIVAKNHYFADYLRGTWENIYERDHHLSPSQCTVVTIIDQRGNTLARSLNNPAMF